MKHLFTLINKYKELLLPFIVQNKPINEILTSMEIQGNNLFCKSNEIIIELGM